MLAVLIRVNDGAFGSPWRSRYPPPLLTLSSTVNSRSPRHRKTLPVLQDSSRLTLSRFIRPELILIVGSP
ncbi:MAG: hypothetical protein HC840_22075 [Leptolyngbyaceae cyanobacterium RM2_2_4]|nr:hypothetical protein [Leptolyngbyaceae cyanobacterium RM2_2_4]